MRASNFFADLSKTYQAEIDDHSSDSEGKNVLRAQLSKKRRQLPELLQMIEFAPEMVALCFHEGLSFPYPKILDALVAQEPDDFPEWAELAQSIELTPWAEKQVELVLQEPGGAQFMCITAGLEFLIRRSHVAPAVGGARIGDEDAEEEDNSDEARDDAESDDIDLEQAGADWLAEQGFDRRD
jgi:hypothetical protein